MKVQRVEQHHIKLDSDFGRFIDDYCFKSKNLYNYSIYLRQERAFVKDLLLEECIKLVKEFEDNDCKVSIDDSGNGYYINFIITVSWDGKVKTREKATFHNNRHLYDTDNGVINTEDLEDGW